MLHKNWPRTTLSNILAKVIKRGCKLCKNCKDVNVKTDNHISIANRDTKNSYTDDIMTKYC